MAFLSHHLSRYQVFQPIKMAKCWWIFIQYGSKWSSWKSSLNATEQLRWSNLIPLLQLCGVILSLLLFLTTENIVTGFSPLASQSTLTVRCIRPKSRERNRSNIWGNWRARYVLRSALRALGATGQTARGIYCASETYCASGTYCAVSNESRNISHGYWHGRDHVICCAISHKKL